MSPSAYKSRYDNLPVRLKNGQTQTVRVNQYRLASKNYNKQEADKLISKFMDMFRKGRFDVALNIHAGSGWVTIGDRDLDDREQAFNKRTGLDTTWRMEGSGGDIVKTSSQIHQAITDWPALLRYAFLGKGAPEHVQVVLQLADHWNLAPHGLQAYADNYLGLDCNGFVGNYLWHARRGNSWTWLGIGKGSLGPDTWIGTFFQGAPLLSAWSQMEPSKSYLMGMVDKNGTIIGGGPKQPPGHIVITEPGQRAPRGNAFAVRVVEATGGHMPGLWESWYSLRKVHNRIFDVDREDMQGGSRHVSFKIVEVR